MYSLIKVMSRPDATRAGITFGVALVIAESLYTFHSFSLECIAFVGTWLALDALAQAFTPRSRRRISEQD